MRGASARNILKTWLLAALLAALFAGLGWLIADVRGATLFAFASLLGAAGAYAVGDRALLGMLGARPFALAADPLLCPSEGKTDLDIVQTGAWIMPDDRPLPDGLEEFLDGGAPPVYVGFGSAGLHANPDLGRIAVEAIRAHGRRVVLARGWAGLDLTDDRDDCFVVDCGSVPAPRFLPDPQLRPTPPQSHRFSARPAGLISRADPVAT